MKFVNRKIELDWLAKISKKERSLLVIYGRRRIGKTRLIQEFLTEKDAFFFTFSDTPQNVQIQEFKDRAAEYLKDNMITKLTGDWYDVLRFFFDKVKNKNIVVLDEFTYAIKSDKKILSDMQRLWDHELKNKKINIILCGSLLGMIKEEVLSHTSPLYGRRTRDLELKALRYRDAAEFFSSSDYALEAYMLLGGVPEYLVVADEYNNSVDLLQNEFLDSKGYFYKEPYFLLSQDLKEIRVYFAILNAIAYGNTKPTNIANFVGIETKAIYPYLEPLQRLGFIRRETALGGNLKRGIYFISDPMLYTWFNIVYKNRHEIELVIAKVNNSEISRILGRPFEALVLEYILFLNRTKNFGFDKVGRWWHKDKEIDIVCLDTKKKCAILLETKYTKIKTPNKILKNLENTAEYTPWYKAGWKMKYGVIARTVENKEKMSEKGYLVYDMENICQ
jgi:AAA+ ATPase superfamily predicted ATPase